MLVSLEHFTVWKGKFGGKVQKWKVVEILNLFNKLGKSKCHQHIEKCLIFSLERQTERQAIICIRAYCIGTTYNFFILSLQTYKGKS